MGIKEDQLAPGEHIVMTLRTHPKVLVGPVVLSIVLVVAGMLLSWLASGAEQRVYLWWGIAILVAVGLLRFLAWPIWRWQSETYTFTNRRLITRTGIINRSGRDIPLFRINDTEMKKDFIDRMFGCGTLIISDATEKPGMELYDIPHVERVQVKIQELIHQADDGTDDGVIPPGEPSR